MRMDEKRTEGALDLRGNIQVVAVDEDGHVSGRWEFKNVICNTGKSLLISALAGNNVATSHMAWGNGTTNTASTDIKLTNETGRKHITNQTAGGTGAYVTRCYLGPNEGNGTIEELGWFIGPSTTDVKDSGVLLAHVLWHYVKSAGTSLIITRTDTLA